MIVSGIILIVYCLLLLAFSIGFTKVKHFNQTAPTPITKFSIIIPFRNEAENLPALLQSLSLLNYPKDFYEILFIDDASQDDSVAILKKSLDLPVQVIENRRKSKSPKKDAIEIAISQSKFDWILTTDADCIVPENWLLRLDTFIQKEHPKMIAAPVNFISNNTLLEQFQLLDFMALQATTIGAFGIKKPFLCNGANLCYLKSAFQEVNGFIGNEHIASGDDLFLLEKMIARFPERVKFLKSKTAVVLTKPEPSWKQLISQRVRWAAKSTSYSNPFSKFVSIIVFGMNSIILILFLGSVFNYFSWSFFSIIFGIKFLFDVLLLFQMASFIKQKQSLIHIFWFAVVYPIFIIFIALKSFTTSYSWKGRVFKK